MLTAKYFITIIFAIGLAFLFSCKASKETYLFDNARMIPDTVQKDLNKQLEQLAEKGHINLYVVTVLSEKFHDEGANLSDSVFAQYGATNKPVVLFYTAWSQRKIVFRTNRNGQLKLSDERCADLVKDVASFYSQALYSEGIIFIINKIDSLTSPID